MFGKNILLLVPHPDDEVVACSAAIGRAQASGATVFALYLTHGCIDQATLWPWQRKHYDRFVMRRHAEAEQVSNLLDLFPLTPQAGSWVSRPARHLWQELPQVYEDVQAAVAHYNIDQLWLPAYEGGNPDHDALNAIGSLFKPVLSVLEFAEYNFKNGKAQAQTFPAPNGSETILTLTPEEQSRKHQALALYKSEKQNLNYVGVTRESFRPLAAYDYAKPPHEGKLWYARFQWAPFRHPRVDFTKPEQVSAAITAFLTEAASGLPAAATQ
jgi:LmbE family N-acetylglucosaminyl deacetylase